MASCQLPQCVRIGIDPIAAHLGGFNLYWYGVLVAVGFIVAIWLGTREADREGLDGDQVLSAVLVAALSGALIAAQGRFNGDLATAGAGALLAAWFSYVGTLATVALVLTVAWLLYRRRDWLSFVQFR